MLLLSSLGHLEAASITINLGFIMASLDLVASTVYVTTSALLLSIYWSLIECRPFLRALSLVQVDKVRAPRAS
jgi:hypothetical protein